VERLQAVQACTICAVPGGTSAPTTAIPMPVDTVNGTYDLGYLRDLIYAWYSTSNNCSDAAQLL
jgi:hypothetical protein